LRGLNGLDVAASGGTLYQQGLQAGGQFILRRVQDGAAQGSFLRTGFASEDNMPIALCHAAIMPLLLRAIVTRDLGSGCLDGAIQPVRIRLERFEKGRVR
jgi:hypothetical protein